MNEHVPFQHAIRNADPDDLVESNYELAFFMARKYHRRGQFRDCDFDDLLSACLLGLVVAAEKFDASKGWKFSSYAGEVMLNECRKVTKQNQPHPLPAKTDATARLWMEFEDHNGRLPTVAEVNSLPALKEARTRDMRQQRYDCVRNAVQLKRQAATIDDVAHLLEQGPIQFSEFDVADARLDGYEVDNVFNYQGQCVICGEPIYNKLGKAKTCGTDDCSRALKKVANQRQLARARQTVLPRDCIICGRAFTPKRNSGTVCSTPCNHERANRRQQAKRQQAKTWTTSVSTLAG